MGNKKNQRSLPTNKPKHQVLDRADREQQGQRTMVSTRDKVTLSKTELDALKKAAAEDLKKKRELDKMAQAQKKLLEDLEMMRSKLEQAQEVIKSNEGNVAMATDRRIKKSELNNDLVQHTMAAAKTFLFRQTKFVEDIMEEKELTKEIIPHLGVDLPISKEEYIAKYSGIVYNGIKAACTDVQSNAKKRAQGSCIRSQKSSVCVRIFLCN